MTDSLLSLSLSLSLCWICIRIWVPEMTEMDPQFISVLGHQGWGEEKIDINRHNFLSVCYIWESFRWRPFKFLKCIALMVGRAVRAILYPFVLCAFPSSSSSLPSSFSCFSKVAKVFWEVEGKGLDGGIIRLLGAQSIHIHTRTKIRIGDFIRTKGLEG